MRVQRSRLHHAWRTMCQDYQRASEVTDLGCTLFFSRSYSSIRSQTTGGPTDPPPPNANVGDVKRGTRVRIYSCLPVRGHTPLGSLTKPLELGCRDSQEATDGIQKLVKNHQEIISVILRWSGQRASKVIFIFCIMLTFFETLPCELQELQQLGKGKCHPIYCSIRNVSLDLTPCQPASLQVAINIHMTDRVRNYFFYDKFRFSNER